MVRGESSDAFLKSLHGIYGQQAYSIHAKSDFTWTVRGAVTPAQVKWQANAYNFVGFSVHPVSAPTFAQFFAGANPLKHNKIYRLANGTWRRVSDATAETMRSGESFWIYCDGLTSMGMTAGGDFKYGHSIRFRSGHQAWRLMVWLREVANQRDPYTPERNSQAST